ncbi:MAG TPA: hypothetical protein VFY34_03900 [Pyrinomonadaceae bacterium]|nr:hypothetical protein [Pyrinomonadaceae bacterium]
MKLFFVALLVAAMVTNVSPNSAATYNNAVSGAQTAAAESGSVAFNLTATGDLPGMFSLTLKHEGGDVNGGTWTLTVLPPNADATSSESGTLTGSFSGGTLTLDANGIATAANSIQLSVTSGTGQFASITSGSGTLNLSADAENSTKLGGPFALSF